jgi:hypothetical protein
MLACLIIFLSNQPIYTKYFYSPGTHLLDNDMLFLLIYIFQHIILDTNLGMISIINYVYTHMCINVHTSGIVVIFIT